jgi:hypothetical protein
MPAVTIDEITLTDEPASWAALGFAVSDAACQIGAVRLRFAATGAEQDPSPRPGIVGWSLRGVHSSELDGLPTTISEHPPSPDAGAHPNGVVAIDHIVAASPVLDRSIAALQAAGLDLRRVREEPTPAGAPRQAFFRLGREILELVQEPYASISDDDASPEGERDRPARFWGLALVVEDLDRSAKWFAPHLGEARRAVQPGRRIASVRRSAGLAVALALMSIPPGGGGIVIGEGRDERAGSPRAHSHAATSAGTGDERP